MPIAALSEYYEFQKRTGRLQTTDAYSSVKISYLICLTPEGTIADILCHKKTVELGNGKTKDIPNAEIFPRRIEIPAIRANVIEHRPAYIFGVYYDAKEKALVTDGDKDKAKKSHDAFVEKQQEFLGDLDTPLARAVLRFTETWSPAEGCDNPHLLGIAKDLGTSGFAFCLAGAPSKLLNNEEAVRQKWEAAYHAEDSDNDEAVIAQCAVSGKPARIARLHNNLKGIRGGQTSGVNLVCFKESAYDSSEIDVIRGIEGNCAKRYFDVFDQMILQRNGFCMVARTKRPPLDRTNAVLSFLYTLYTSDFASALEGVGLDSYIGYFHTLRPGRCSLACDMVEEVRCLVERLTLSLINLKILNQDDFDVQVSGATFLNSDGRKKVLTRWQEKKRSEIKHPYLKQKIQFGLIPFIQANLMAKFLRGELSEYPSFLLK